MHRHGEFVVHGKDWMAYTAEVVYDSVVCSEPLAEMNVLLKRIERGSRAVRGLHPFVPNSEMLCVIAGAFGMLLQVLVSLKIAHSGRGLAEASLDGDHLIWSLLRRVFGLMLA